MKISKKFNNGLISIILSIFILSMSACSAAETTGGDSQIDNPALEVSVSDSVGSNSENSSSQASQGTGPETINNETDTEESDDPIKDVPLHTSSDIEKNNTVKVEETEHTNPYIDGSALIYNDISYSILDVDGGNRSGNREYNVAVDIGFGDRVYWGLTNEHGQLVIVIADKIILQDDNSEPVNSRGRYYNDEAAVPGTEHEDLDQGHVIADSLGGVSNAYNITPQDSTLNRHGDQAYMEKVIRDAGGCKNFVATITYPNTTTQTPSHYHYEYDLMGNHIVDDFDNINPDEYNAEHLDKVDEVTANVPLSSNNNDNVDEKDLSLVDTNGNGKVTIAEAKAAGYKMPITSDCWLYKYMLDKDKDGMVGE